MAHGLQVSHPCYRVSLREKTNAELRESMDIEKFSDVMKYSRLR